jgi:hypothetical protein
MFGQLKQAADTINKTRFVLVLLINQVINLDDYKRLICKSAGF